MMTVYASREGRIEWELNRKTKILEVQGLGPIPEFSPFQGVLPSWTPLRDQFQEVRVGQGITRIGEYAFYPYDHGIYADIRAPLRRVVFPLTLESIGCSAFRANTRLTAIDLHGLGNLRSIDENAFASCFEARAANLSGCACLNEIHPRAFWGCDAIAYIDLEGCFSLPKDALQALRRETASHIPIILPDGCVWSDGDSPAQKELECRVFLRNGNPNPFIRGPSPLDAG